MGITHIAVDLSLGDQGRDRVDNDNVDRAGTHHCLRDLQRLFAAVRLGNIEVVDIHADVLGVNGIQRVLRVDEACDAAPLLHFRDHVQGHGRLTGGLRSVDLNDPSLGNTAKAEGDIKAQGACGNGLDIHLNGRVAKFHDCSLAVLLLNLQKGRVKRLLLLVIIYAHLISSKITNICSCVSIAPSPTARKAFRRKNRMYFRFFKRPLRFETRICGDCRNPAPEPLSDLVCQIICF